MLSPTPKSPALFPQRGRTGREDDDPRSSWDDFDRDTPEREGETPVKRRQSPFSNLFRRRRRSSAARPSTADGVRNVSDPLPPVPPLPIYNHTRNLSDPQSSNTSKSSDSSPSLLSSGSGPTQHQRQHSKPRWEEDALSTAHALFPTPTTPLMATAAVIAAGAGGRRRGIDGLPGSGGHGHGLRGNDSSERMDKAKMAGSIGPLITMGMENLHKASSVIEGVVDSDSWSVDKADVTAVFAPARDVIAILDSMTKYIPVFMVAESVLSIIVAHELERNENDKYILVVYHSMTTFWITLCDLQMLLRVAEGIKGPWKEFFEKVNETMNDFGNFSEVYYKHGHFVRTLRSGEYRKKLTSFATTFTDHKTQLQFLLTEHTALEITDVRTSVNGVAAKLESVEAKLDRALELVGRQTEMEVVIAREVKRGGGEGVLQDPQFLDELARKHFGATDGLETQIHAGVQQGLEEALKANLPAFSLRVEAYQKEMMETLERTTEAILHQLNSGQYQLIKDEDIRTVWKTVHNHFAQKFGDHRHNTGEMHPEQWTLNVLSQVIYYPNISDAIDDDGSGYISVQEVNQFFKARPEKWSAVQWLAFWAAGWKQNALKYVLMILSQLENTNPRSYQTRCKTLFSTLESTAHTVLPQNMRPVKNYIKGSGLSELWLIVNSITPDHGHGHRSLRQAPETGPLNALRAEVMEGSMRRVGERLERMKYQLDRPETISAVLATHRLEGSILCLLELLLERHVKIIQTANTLVLAPREFDAMAASLRNVVLAFNTRYCTLMQSWKQQRLETDCLVQWFAGGIFGDWNKVFQDHDHTASNHIASRDATDSQYAPPAIASRCPRKHLVIPDPGSPPPRILPSPPLHPLGPRHRSRAEYEQRHRTDNEYFHPRFEFERTMPGGNIVDPESIPEVYRKRTAKPKLEDRITAIESELGDIKDMLGQLMLLSSSSPKRPPL
ncbi:hypothetical protein FB45DRAFT_1054454 [Roridomyces roridus]|uniref:EF-hand domain-containing protein n=1 Tax=Roridomyces roridus TaxID=1738132 RepID=A0AAD7C9D5_9AGAR|nr:hypothetical protein FB45DRAFT_1054454 [Roridomyces roridus]